MSLLRTHPEAKKYAAADKNVSCPHCGGTAFLKSKAQLNTAGLTFFKLDWLDPSATTLLCMQCGQIQWFVKEPVES